MTTLCQNTGLQTKTKVVTFNKYTTMCCITTDKNQSCYLLQVYNDVLYYHNTGLNGAVYYQYNRVTAKKLIFLPLLSSFMGIHTVGKTEISPNSTYFNHTKQALVCYVSNTRPKYSETSKYIFSGTCMSLRNRSTQGHVHK